jgi:hypothetical protein
MRLASPLQELHVREHLPRVAMYLMLGFIMGFLLFQKIFPYFSAPIEVGIPTWLFVLFISGIGFAANYLYPDITNVLLGSIALPVLGGIFCFLIYISPALSPDIMSSGLSEDLVYLARLLLFDMLMAFLILIVVGFMTVYLFESDE